MNKIKSIISVLKQMETDTLINIWNDYCNEENVDDYIYTNDEYTLNDLFGGRKDGVNEVLRMAHYGHYDYTDDYFIINAYGNFTSFDEYDAEQHIDFDYLANFIADNDCREIQENYIEDIICDFITFFHEKFEDIEIDEDFDFSSYNLLTEEWDDIAEDIIETIKSENNDEENEN